MKKEEEKNEVYFFGKKSLKLDGGTIFENDKLVVGVSWECKSEKMKVISIAEKDGRFATALALIEIFEDGKVHRVRSFVNYKIVEKKIKELGAPREILDLFSEEVWGR
jgi:hypothetical protein